MTKLYPDLEKIKIQHYSCQGCANCSNLKQIDLRTRQGVYLYLIKKRSCYLEKLKNKITILQEKVSKVEEEIKSYEEAIKSNCT
jgi:hypothetical protein